jgi:glycerophosphoryl diester phosphodiesterase
MDIIEQFSRGKTGDEALNEDNILVSEDFIAVLDGVTSRRGRSLRGMATGRFASQFLAATLAQLPADIDARSACAALNKALMDESTATAVAENLPLAEVWAYPASALLVYSRARREVWRVADSTFLIDGVANYRFFPQERVWADLRRAYLHAQLARGVTVESLLDHDPTFDLLTPMISELKIFANSESPHAGIYGYGVLNGTTLPDRYLEVFPAANAKEIVYASDGYPEVINTLEETENALQKTVREDPLMFRIHPQVMGVRKGYESFDDRSYIRFTV